jgi:hypothetical protein
MRLQIQVKTSTTLKRMCIIPRRISEDHLFREAIPPSESCRTCQKIDPAGLRGSQMKRVTLKILPMFRRRAHHESGMYHHHKRLQCNDFSEKNRRPKVLSDQRPLHTNFYTSLKTTSGFSVFYCIFIAGFLGKLLRCLCSFGYP